MIRKVLIALVLAVTVAQAQTLQPAAPAVNPMLEYRQCGEPKRDKNDRIARSTSVLRAYQKLHPCPATGKTSGACPGWAINHVIPLAKGGCDSVINLMWVPVQIKSCSSQYCIDRWERTYYGVPHGIVTFKDE